MARDESPGQHRSATITRSSYERVKSLSSRRSSGDEVGLRDLTPYSIAIALRRPHAQTIACIPCENANLSERGDKRPKASNNVIRKTGRMGVRDRGSHRDFPHRGGADLACCR